MHPLLGRCSSKAIHCSTLTTTAARGCEGNGLVSSSRPSTSFPVLTATENVEIPLLLAGQPAHDVRKVALEALASVGLADRAGHLPAMLSGGQQQRVAVARAVVHRPSIVLCDEPTGNLDSVTSNEVLDLMSTLCREEGMTFLIVTHDDAVAARCDRVLRMRDGQFLDDASEEA